MKNWCVVAVLLSGSVASMASAQVDHGGEDFTVTSGAVLEEDHFNIGVFTIPPGANVPARGAILIHADEIRVSGTLDATGTGHPGGFERDECSGADTLIGANGPGAGQVGRSGDPWPTAQGGGGGGHGGVGGAAELLTMPGTEQGGEGGALYSTTMDPFALEMGSGGGRGEVLCCPCSSGRGGAGGGAIALRAATEVRVDGTVLVNGGAGTMGSDGAANKGPGGGGAGGTIILDSGRIVFTGTLEARGGAGGTRPDSAGGGDIGGGGAGGRVRLLGMRVEDTGTIDVSGGMGGSPGAVGTVFRGMMPVDVDGDGIPNRMDDCANDHLNDSDGDGLCANVDPCPIMDTDNDSDGDGLCAADDNCPGVANPDQLDADFDTVGDACDPDRDGDSIANGDDNCPDVANLGQADSDSDGVGDACDACPGDVDEDEDGACDMEDVCPGVADPDQEDGDADGVGDLCDNCPEVENGDQADEDEDDVGDACDVDADNDGVADDADNCVDTPNPEQDDTDGDEAGDACDDDDDDDGVQDGDDACPLVAGTGADGCPAGEDAGGGDPDAGPSGDYVERVDLGCSAGGNGGGAWLGLLALAWLARRRRGALAALLVAATLAVGAPAEAQSEEPPPEEARVHFQLGRVNYDAGRFEDAAREFWRAWELSERPLLLYNVFLARRDMGDLEGAAEALSMYLERSGEELEGNQRLRLTRTLETLEARLEREAAGAESGGEEGEENGGEEGGESGGEESGEGLAAGGGAIEDVDFEEAVAPEESSGEGGGGMSGATIGAIAGYGVAGVALVTALAMQLKMGSVEDDLDSACTFGASGNLCPADFDQQSLADQHDTYRVTRWAMLGVALAGIAAGTTLLLLGGDEDDPEAAASLGCSPEGCMGVVRVRY